MKPYFHFCLIFIVGLSASSFGQSNELEHRENLGRQFISDSCYSHVFGFLHNDYREKEKFPDSLLLPNKTSEPHKFFQNFKIKKEKRVFCDNYIFASVGDSIAAEFLAYQNTSSELEKDTNSLRYRKFQVLVPNYHDTLSETSLIYSHNTLKYWIRGPLFNKNRDLMLVELGDRCGGLCGIGATILYEFKNGRWVEKAVIIKWVS